MYRPFFPAARGSKVWCTRQPTGQERYENFGLPSQAKKKIARRNWSASGPALVKSKKE